MACLTARPPVRPVRPFSSDQRPAVSMPTGAVRYRRVAPLSGLRLLEGVMSARSPAKLSDVTRPRPASSLKPCSTCVGSKPDIAVSSWKNEAPRCSKRLLHNTGVAGELRLRLKSIPQPGAQVVP